MPEIREPFKCQDLQVRVFQAAEEMGEVAADFVAQTIQQAIQSRGKARVTFATGASQFEFLKVLIQHNIEWPRVEAFHLDEYIGLPEDHPASFRKYLNQRLFHIVKPGAVHLMDGTTDVLQEEIDRYTQLLMEDEIDLACIGIGENGHIAFNDPPVADFEDPQWVKVVELDEECRQQQFGEGWFERLEDVPRQALTQTVPAILRSKRISCFVPDERKAEAVYQALYGPLSTSCPASILRTHEDAVLWLDEAAARKLPEK